MTSMTPAEVDAYQARLRELLEERRQAHQDTYYPRGGGRLLALLAAGAPSHRQQAIQASELDDEDEAS